MPKINGIEHPDDVFESLWANSKPSEVTCTCVSKRGHYRTLRDGSKHYFYDQICGDKAIIVAYNPLTSDAYYVCKRHWDDEALHAADRMGLKYRRIEE
jgi:hypothetical protein